LSHARVGFSVVLSGRRELGDTTDSNTPPSAPQISELLDMLDSHSLPERLTAIQVLGEIGDLAALQRLRERPPQVNEELQSLVIAVGRLKKRLGVK
jgi:HAMP domain-containing protein